MNGSGVIDLREKNEGSSWENVEPVEEDNRERLNEMSAAA